MANNDDPFTFETIAQVYREERKSALITKLPPHFFNKMDDYIKRLKENFLAERQNEPSSPKAMMLEDEFQKAQRRAQEIYELRERKIVLLALSKANGGDPNIPNLTDEEKNAFQYLIETLLQNRHGILSGTEKDKCKSVTFLTSFNKKNINEPIEEKHELVSKSADIESAIEEPHEPGVDESEEKNPVLLILEDIPSFETRERSFNLKKDDTITLPDEYANILCKHGKAKVIKN